MLKTIVPVVAVIMLAISSPTAACDDAVHARELRELRAQTRAAQDEARAARDLVRIERDKLRLLDRHQRNQR